MKIVFKCEIESKQKFTGQSRELYVAIMSSLYGYIFSNNLHVIISQST